LLKAPGPPINDVGRNQGMKPSKLKANPSARHSHFCVNTSVFSIQLYVIVFKLYVELWKLTGVFCNSALTKNFSTVFGFDIRDHSCNAESVNLSSTTRANGHAKMASYFWTKEPSRQQGHARPSCSRHSRHIINGISRRCTLTT
jgi:hypothetical protein